MANGENNLYEFDKFRFDAKTFKLWRENQIVLLSPKASELLACLLKKRGEFVSKEEIFDSVWTNTFVEDGVLTQNIYTLRKTLGTDADGQPIIENKTRLGYRIAAPVRIFSEAIAIDNSSDGKEILPAASASEISEKRLPDSSPSAAFGNGKRIALLLITAVVLLGVAAFLIYRSPQKTATAYLTAPIERLQFRKLTDTGEISSPIISHDGNFTAFVQDGRLLLKDLKSNRDIALDVPNHKVFGSLRFSGDDASIFFRNQKEPHLTSGVYKISRFGGEARLIVEDVWTQFGLAPDDRQIAFVRYFASQNYYVLIVKNLDSGKEQEILKRSYPEFPAFNSAPSWSPDGTRIALTVQDRAKLLSQLIVIDVKTGAEKIVPTDEFKQIEEVVWLPDNESVIVSANQSGKFMQLWKIELANGSFRRITNDLSSYQNLSITADGKKIVASQFMQHSNLWTATNGKPENLKQITFSNARLDGLSAIDWISDERIVYVSHEIQKPFQEIWAVNPTDNSRTPLTENTDFQAEFPAASPNYKNIFFNSNKTGLMQIWRVNENGGNPSPITFDDSGHNGLPVISLDGNWLYYLNKKGAVSSIRRKSLTDDTDAVFFVRDDTSPSAWIAVSRDGKFVGFINYADRSSIDGLNRTYQIIVASTENLSDMRFHKISASARYFGFSPDGNSLEYIENTAAEGRIWRQSLADETKRELIFTVPKDKIFHFTWSKDGKHLAIARGQQINDAVMLSDFE